MTDYTLTLGGGGTGVSGTSGISGATGAAGISGTSGIAGATGASGYSGVAGAAGISGTSGSIGISGYSGKSGATGISGYSGTIGISGYSGKSGATGISGYSGATGGGGGGSPGGNDTDVQTKNGSSFAGDNDFTYSGYGVANLGNVTSATTSLTIGGSTPTEADLFIKASTTAYTRLDAPNSTMQIGYGTGSTSLIMTTNSGDGGYAEVNIYDTASSSQIQMTVNGGADEINMMGVANNLYVGGNNDNDTNALNVGASSTYQSTESILGTYSSLTISGNTGNGGAASLEVADSNSSGSFAVDADSDCNMYLNGNNSAMYISDTNGDGFSVSLSGGSVNLTLTSGESDTFINLPNLPSGTVASPPALSTGGLWYDTSTYIVYWHP